MTQEIQVLENQYQVAHKAWLEAVRVHDEIRTQYIAMKEGRDRIKVMHTSAEENEYQAQPEALEAILSSFEQAFGRLDEAYRQADLECRRADEAAKECKTQLDAARRAAGYSS